MQLPIKTIRGATEAIRQYLGEIDLSPCGAVIHEELNTLFQEIDEKLSQIESSTHYLIKPYHDENVDLFAMGYTWTCHECSTVHESRYAGKEVYCPVCCVKFKVDEVNSNLPDGPFK
jgi:hypothetical protein